MTLEAAELVLLGSGTAIPTPRRGPTGHLVVQRDEVILVDPGPGSVKRACDAGFPVEKITRVLLTHHHPDHCLDLVALLFARRNGLLKDLCPVLEIMGGPGTQDFLDRLGLAFGKWIEQEPGQLVVRELGPGAFSMSERITGEAFAIQHTPASLAYRLTLENGAVLALSGDTEDCPGAVDVAVGADHYLLEAAMPDDGKVVGHITPKIAARIAQDAGCRHLIMTHFYPPVDIDGALESASRHFAGRITIAEDGLRVSLTVGDTPGESSC